MKVGRKGIAALLLTACAPALLHLWITRKE